MAQFDKTWTWTSGTPGNPVAIVVNSLETRKVTVEEKYLAGTTRYTVSRPDKNSSKVFKTNGVPIVIEQLYNKPAWSRGTVLGYLDVVDAQADFCQLENG